VYFNFRSVIVSLHDKRTTVLNYIKNLNPKLQFLLLFVLGAIVIENKIVGQTPLQHWDAGSGTTVNTQNRILSWVSGGLAVRTATPLNIVNSPTLISNDPNINGKSSIAFSIESPIIQPMYFQNVTFDTATIFIVASMPNITNTMHFIVSGINNGTYNGGFWLGGNQSDILGFGWGAGPPYNNLQSNLEPRGWQVFAMKNNKLFLNGVETGKTFTGWPVTTIINHFGGIDAGWADHLFRGYLGELFIYNHHLTDSAIIAKSDSLITVYKPILDLGPQTIDTCATQLILQPLNNAHFRTYLWSTGATTRSINVQQDGVYWLEVNSFGVTQRDTITVTGLTTAPIISLQSDTVLCKESPFYVHAVDPSGATIIWQNGFQGDSLFINKEGLISYTKTFTTPSGQICNLQSQVRNVSGVIVPQFISSQTCLGDSTNLTNTSQILLGNLDTLEWQIMGQSVAGNANTKYLFPNAGIFQVGLIVKSDLGCSDTIVQNVTVKGVPTPNFSWDKECKGSQIRFNNQTIIPSNESVLNYVWVAPPLPNSSIVNPSFLFPSNLDTAAVTLVVNLQNGCSDQKTISVPVNKFVVADFNMVSPQDTLCQFASYDFASNVQAVNTSIQSINWRINNVSYSQDNNPSISFQQSGNQNLRLSLLSSDGCSDSLTRVIRVRPKPKAILVPSQTLGIPPFEISLTNASTGQFQTTEWLFPDGTGSSAAGSVQYTVQDTGLFQFGLKVNDNIECKDETQVFIRGVRPELSADIENLECKKTGDSYEALMYLRNTSSILPLTEMNLSWSLENSDRFFQSITDSIQPGGLLPFKFSGTIMPRTNPGYCCANIDFLATTLANNQQIEGNPVSRCVPMTEGFQVFTPVPNPTKDFVRFFVNSPFEDVATITISDTQGRVLLTRTISFTIGLNQLVLDVASIQSGVHYLNVQIRDLAESVKFVITQ
jgi:hypothetical protein